MKTLRFLGTALIATLMCVACSNEEIVPEEQEAKYVTVDLGVTGEYLDLYNVPLATRTSTTPETYAIEVSSIQNDSTTQSYAYGIFNSLNNVKIKLLEGQQYHFSVYIVNDNFYEVQQGSGIYWSPEFNTRISNEFSYSINGGISYLPPYQKDIFYGQLNYYTPTQNSTVEIPTKRVVYGAHFIAEGLTEGSLNINVGDLYSVRLTSDFPEDDNIYRFNNLVDAWRGIPIFGDGMKYGYENYYSTKRLYITGILNGIESYFGEYSVTFRRNVKTTIRIKVKDKSDISNGIVITREEAPMTNDDKEYVIEVEDGTITEVPVTSQQ